MVVLLRRLPHPLSGWVGTGIFGGCKSLDEPPRRNKQDRISDIEATLNEILDAKKVRPKELPSHLGRLQFADMQVAGRAGKLAMCDLNFLFLLLNFNFLCFL